MSFLTPKFADAFLYAAEAHAGQTRKKTGRPYIGHLMGVCALALQYGGDEDAAIAAMLHDVVEDCGGRPRLDDIRARFGERVAGIVEGCTDSFEQDAQRKPAWRERKQQYVEHVGSAAADTRLVSAADKLYNVREILLDYRAHGEAVWELFQGRRDGTLWYYRALVTAFRDASRHAASDSAPQLDALVDELDRAVTELERLASAASA